MNSNELSNVIHDCICEIITSQNDFITKNLASISTSSNVDEKALFNLFSSCVEISVNASIKTLIDLGYLDISP